MVSLHKKVAGEEEFVVFMQAISDQKAADRIVDNYIEKIRSKGFTVNGSENSNIIKFYNPDKNYALAMQTLYLTYSDSEIDIEDLLV